MPFRSGDVEDALKKIKKFVCSKPAFFQVFIEEGLKFTSSLYLMLIWIQVLKFILGNPMEVGKQMVNVPFFDKFQKTQTTDNYVDGLVRSMAGLKISATPERPAVTRSLAEMEDSEEEEETEILPKKKKSKKSKARRE